MKEGFVLTGTLVGNKRIVRTDSNTGQLTNKYQYLLVGDDLQTHYVTSDNDYTGMLMFGDTVSFDVKPNVFNNRLYLKGDLHEEES